MWNFFPLTHSPTEPDERQGKDAPPYLDTGQMESTLGQIPDLEESCNRGSSHVGGTQETLRDEGKTNTQEGEKYDLCEPMDQGVSCERVERSSSEDSAMEKGYEEVATSNTLTVRPLEPMGLKSPLHRSLSNLPGEEATESLCVEVENESLSERLQDVESELEYIGCGREGMSEREDDGPKAKKRRLQV